MDRLFATHHVRAAREAAPVWTLTTPDAGGLPAPQTTLAPDALESHPALRNYRGRAVFEQRLACGGNVRLWFGGVSFRARVYLDDALLAEHYGAYTGFEALATGVPGGVHRLRVETDNRFDADSALHIPNDYYAYGGITRPVTVETLGDAWVEALEARPALADGRWQVELRARVSSLSDAPLALELLLGVEGVAERSLPVALPPRGSAELRATLDCPGVTPWSPQCPALYFASALLLRAGVPVDDLRDRFGFRELRVRGSRLLLNGAPLRLLGFNRHEEYGGFGCAVPPQAMLQDLRLIRDMGGNCVRTCHYPNDPRFLDLCDELGVLVWEESHARGLDETHMRHPRFMPQLEACTREMVAQHFNHPSVILWACLNECADDTEYGADCYRRLLALLRALDGTRPVTAALLERPGGRVYGDCDVVSVNLYPLWYHETEPAEALARKRAEIDANGGAGKPVIVSEIGAGAIYGFHDPLGRAKWSEECQSELLARQIRGVLSDPDCAGVFLWQLADVRVDDSWAMKRPRTMNNKGVVDEFRRPKLAYATVKALFAEYARPET